MYIVHRNQLVQKKMFITRAPELCIKRLPVSYCKFLYRLNCSEIKVTNSFITSILLTGKKAGKKKYINYDE